MTLSENTHDSEEKGSLTNNKPTLNIDVDDLSVFAKPSWCSSLKKSTQSGMNLFDKYAPKLEGFESGFGSSSYPIVSTVLQTISHQKQFNQMKLPVVHQVNSNTSLMDYHIEDDDYNDDNYDNEAVSSTPHSSIFEENYDSKEMDFIHIRRTTCAVDDHFNKHSNKVLWLNKQPYFDTSSISRLFTSTFFNQNTTIHCSKQFSYQNNMNFSKMNIKTHVNSASMIECSSLSTTASTGDDQSGHKEDEDNNSDNDDNDDDNDDDKDGDDQGEQDPDKNEEGNGDDNHDDKEDNSEKTEAPNKKSVKEKENLLRLEFTMVVEDFEKKANTAATIPEVSPLYGDDSTGHWRLLVYPRSHRGDEQWCSTYLAAAVDVDKLGHGWWKKVDFSISAIHPSDPRINTPSATAPSTSSTAMAAAAASAASLRNRNSSNNNSSSGSGGGSDVTIVKQSSSSIEGSVDDQVQKNNNNNNSIVDKDESSVDVLKTSKSNKNPNKPPLKATGYRKNAADSKNKDKNKKDHSLNKTKNNRKIDKDIKNNGGKDNQAKSVIRRGTNTFKGRGTTLAHNFEWGYNDLIKVDTLVHHGFLEGNQQQQSQQQQNPEQSQEQSLTKKKNIDQNTPEKKEAEDMDNQDQSKSVMITNENKKDINDNNNNKKITKDIQKDNNNTNTTTNNKYIVPKGSLVLRVELTILETNPGVSYSDLPQKEIQDDLVWAVGVAAVPMVKECLTHHANPNLVYDVIKKDTPLHKAASTPGWRPGAAEVVSLLIDNGANVNVINDLEETPLLLAADVSGCPEICLRLLLNGAMTTFRTDNGWSPMNCAAKRGRIEIIKLLVRFNCPLEEPTPEYSAILHAAAQGHIETVLYLLKCGAEANVTDRHGDSALWKLIDQDLSDIGLEMVQEYHASIARCSRDRKKVTKARLMLKHAEKKTKLLELELMKDKHNLNQSRSAVAVAAAAVDNAIDIASMSINSSNKDIIKDVNLMIGSNNKKGNNKNKNKTKGGNGNKLIGGGGGDITTLKQLQQQSHQNMNKKKRLKVAIAAATAAAQGAKDEVTDAVNEALLHLSQHGLTTHSNGVGGVGGGGSSNEAEVAVDVIGDVLVHLSALSESVKLMGESSLVLNSSLNVDKVVSDISNIVLSTTLDLKNHDNNKTVHKSKKSKNKNKNDNDNDNEMNKNIEKDKGNNSEFNESSTTTTNKNIQEKEVDDGEEEDNDKDDDDNDEEVDIHHNITQQELNSSNTNTQQEVLKMKSDIVKDRLNKKKNELMKLKIAKSEALMEQLVLEETKALQEDEKKKLKRNKKKKNKATKAKKGETSSSTTTTSTSQQHEKEDNDEEEDHDGELLEVGNIEKDEKEEQEEEEEVIKQLVSQQREVTPLNKKPNKNHKNNDNIKNNIDEESSSEILIVKETISIVEPKNIPSNQNEENEEKTATTTIQTSVSIPRTSIAPVLNHDQQTTVPLEEETGTVSVCVCVF